MLSKFLKILFSLLILILLQNCGFEPLLTEKYQKFNINTFDISGDKKLGQMLVNRFVETKNAKNELIEIADMVTEMTEVKHHFKASIKAQVGIEF